MKTPTEIVAVRELEGLNQQFQVDLLNSNWTGAAATVNAMARVVHLVRALHPDHFGPIKERARRLGISLDEQHPNAREKLGCAEDCTHPSHHR